MCNRQSICAGALALVSAFVWAGCIAGDSSDQAEDGDYSGQVEESEQTIAEAAPLLSEVLVLDAAESMSRGLFGTKQDYSYRLDGRQILRHEFKVDTHGHANASIQSMDNDQIKVRAWADMYSGYDFTLKVWVAQ